MNEVINTATQILSNALLDLLMKCTDDPAKEFVHKVNEDSSDISGKGLLDQLGNKYNVSNVRQKAEVGLNLGSSFDKPLAERIKYVDLLASTILDLPEAENTFINAINPDSTNDFNIYKKVVQKELKNYLLLWLSPKSQEHCLSFMGSSTTMNGEELLSRITEAEKRTLHPPAAALVATKNNVRNGNNNNEKKKCDIYSGPFHRLKECPKLKKQVPMLHFSVLPSLL